MKSKSVVLFDGVCNLCNGFVQFIIRRDKKDRFRFASLQSPEGQELLSEFPGNESLKTIILIEDGRIYKRSTAALRVARRLPGFWPAFYGLIIIPAPLRDYMYNIVARNRYRWFGKKQECMIPTPELKAKFLTMKNIKKTLVLGASENPERYSNKAIHRLREKGHEVIAIGRKKGRVADVDITTERPLIKNLDTVTMYLNPAHQDEYLDYLLSLKPRRIIFNPGAENPALEARIQDEGIAPIEACTLVLLSTNQF
ncbi:MAG: DCC1-like thiol-disulfide oxidoreductase family protein [Chitinophagaceae bacterium]|nr:DCC1-like thiol-disulfide oxidoreductase family protein [Chitinophagaceae bacterium]